MSIIPSAAPNNTNPASSELTVQAAEVRLAQYGERSGLRVATYGSGTEKALHQIALALLAELATRPSRAEVLREAAGAMAELRDTADMNAADGNRDDFRQRVALRDAEDRIRRMADEATTGGAS
ncbi:hypothetical protein ACFVW9_15325 [Streptomyces sp. NPDC058217]|uniref:hypothetical protein n=1 Tax=Streptomyces sp. NPDC058217 TaxID=3346384 RepID=UPI0036E68F17